MHLTCIYAQFDTTASYARAVSGTSKGFCMSPWSLQPGSSGLELHQESSCIEVPAWKWCKGCMQAAQLDANDPFTFGNLST